ncbi:hypothetical protein PYCCODRAFT_1256934 [Trametes coccinea BRFM310]|uniref:Uncharacterized protein n=1 Tax=Trametes coccinea (strain BRFM310) TaxID=1353009 RepID=A0A1Y2I7T7_TRAC3|nr:hypothetical protein PYCCODRAFT_1256934 [Trametes coccinea BRFM310]
MQRSWKIIRSGCCTSEATSEGERQAQNVLERQQTPSVTVGQARSGVFASERPPQSSSASARRRDIVLIEHARRSPQRSATSHVRHQGRSPRQSHSSPACTPSLHTAGAIARKRVHLQPGRSGETLDTHTTIDTAVETRLEDWTTAARDPSAGQTSRHSPRPRPGTRQAPGSDKRSAAVDRRVGVLQSPGHPARRAAGGGGRARVWNARLYQANAPSSPAPPSSLSPPVPVPDAMLRVRGGKHGMRARMRAVAHSGQWWTHNDSLVRSGLLRSETADRRTSCTVCCADPLRFDAPAGHDSRALQCIPRVHSEKHDGLPYALSAIRSHAALEADSRRQASEQRVPHPGEKFDRGTCRWKLGQARSGESGQGASRCGAMRWKALAGRKNDAKRLAEGSRCD